MKGFSPRNLKYMRRFAQAYPDEPIVQEVLAQITWCHHPCKRPAHKFSVISQESR
jgi:hypothetical protein